LVRVGEFFGAFFIKVPPDDQPQRNQHQHSSETDLSFSARQGSPPAPGSSEGVLKQCRCVENSSDGVPNGKTGWCLKGKNIGNYSAAIGMAR
jgi:hypothetical protein